MAHDLKKALADAHIGPVSPDRPTPSLYSRMRDNMLAGLSDRLEQPVAEQIHPGIADNPVYQTVKQGVNAIDQSIPDEARMIGGMVPGTSSFWTAMKRANLGRKLLRDPQIASMLSAAGPPPSIGGPLPMAEGGKIPTQSARMALTPPPMEGSKNYHQDYQDWIQSNWEMLNRQYRQYRQGLSDPMPFEEWLPSPRGADHAEFKRDRGIWMAQQGPGGKAGSFRAPQSRDIVDTRMAALPDEEAPPTRQHIWQGAAWDQAIQDAPGNLRLPAGTFPRDIDYPLQPENIPPGAMPGTPEPEAPAETGPPQIGRDPGWVPGSWLDQKYAEGGLYQKMRQATLDSLR